VDVDVGGEGDEAKLRMSFSQTATGAGPNRDAVSAEG